jgi:hypothetical protein
MLEAKDALLKTLKSGKDSISGFRDDASLSNYLGNISGLFDGLNNTEETNITKEEESYQTESHQANNNQEANRMEKIDDDVIENADENITEIITENISEDDEYLGPYYEENLLQRDGKVRIF